MKVLVLAPLPPPITGHSLASKAVVDALTTCHETAVIDLTTGSMHDGSVTFHRVAEVLKALRRVIRHRRNADVIYLTISESLAGNIKDLMIYLLCANRLERMVLHLHGGSIRRLLFDRRSWIERINRIFIRRMAGVIVSGQSHAKVFADMIAPDRVHFVPNFADDQLFVSDAVVRAKFGKTDPLRILFISGMNRDKGSPDLVAAYRLLSPEMQRRIRIDIAGRFPSVEERAAFEATLAGLEGIRYHGLVDEATKHDLFAKAHIFCLPTAMFEGQPISILEAYASGCAVLTTDQPGILDVFADGINGHKISVRDPESIARALRAAANDPGGIGRIALENLRTARAQYRVDRFTGTVRGILEDVPALNVA